jgi:carbon storage regulator
MMSGNPASLTDAWFSNKQQGRGQLLRMFCANPTVVCGAMWQFRCLVHGGVERYECQTTGQHHRADVPAEPSEELLVDSTGAYLLHNFANALEKGTRRGDILVSTGGRQMLILTRRVLESLRVDDDITVTVLHVRGDQVRFRITSPRDVGVYREEVINELSRAAKQALASGGEGMTE